VIAINLKKTLVGVTTLITIILCLLLVVGVRQYQLHRHYGQVIEQSEKLLFQFDVVREHITQSLLDKNFSSLAEAGQQIESLHSLLRNILEDQRIADEYKLIFINQVDLPGLVTLLNNAAASPLQQEQRTELARRIRELGDQFTLFNRVVANHAKSTLVNFQTMVIGSLALVLFLVINILVLWHRQVGVPLLNLLTQVKNAAAGRSARFTGIAGSRELAELSGSLSELLRHQQISQAETQRNERILRTTLEATAACGHSSSLKNLFENSCQALLTNEEYCLAWVGMREGSSSALMPAAASGSATMTDGECKECLAALLATSDKDAVENDPPVQAMATGEVVVRHDILAGMARGPIKGTALAGKQVNCVALPLRGNGEPFGVLTVYSLDHASFSALEMESLTRLSGDLARQAQQLKERETREIEHYFTTFLTTSLNLLTATFLPDGTIIEMNGPMEKFCGRPAKEVIGQKFQDIFFTQAEQTIWETTIQAFCSGESREKTFKATLRDRMRAQKFFMHHLQKAAATSATISWIGLETWENGHTDLSAAQPAVNQEKQLNAFAFPAFVLSGEGRVLQANGSALSSCGMQASELKGLDLAALLFARPDTMAAASFRSLLTEKTPALLQTTLEKCRGNFLLAVLPFGYNVFPDNGRTLLLAIPVPDKPEAGVTSLQAALSRQLAEQAEQVNTRVRTLSSDVEKYARVMAATFTQQDQGDHQQNLSEKIMLEGQRIAGIILKQGSEISAIVEQLRTP